MTIRRDVAGRASERGGGEENIEEVVSHVWWHRVPAASLAQEQPHLHLPLLTKTSNDRDAAVIQFDHG